MNSKPVLFAALVLVGCSSGTRVPSPTAPGRRAPVDTWNLVAVDANDPTPALLWNGLIGVRLGRDGTGSNQPFFSVDAYQTSGEEKILELPNPLQLALTCEGEAISPQSGADYLQKLDMRTGELRTSWKQALPQGTVLVACTTAIDPITAALGDKWSFSCDKPLSIDVDASVSDVKALSADRCQWPTGVQATRSIRVDGFSSGPTTMKFQLRAARKTGFSRVYRFGPQISGSPTSFDQLLQATEETWKQRWTTDIEIDGPVEDQQAVHSFLFYLRSAVNPKSDKSVAPYGLSNSQYNGHVFWDADMWVFPSLALIDPDAAATIPGYRARMLPRAERNFQWWLGAARPTAQGNLGPMKGAPVGAKFPWESSVSGKETAPGESKYEDHITGDIAFSASQAADLGLMPESTAHKIRSEADVFFRCRASSDGRHINGVMSPDENHVGDDDLYTNMLANWLATRQGRPALATLPSDETSLLTYAGDSVRGYKQAAAVLTIYPLQNAKAESQAREMMDRFSHKVTKNGPAMTDSIHALIWARLGDRQKAYEVWRESWIPFTQTPLMLFSEKRSKPVTYFTTGASGSLLTVLYGFLGFRIDSQQEQGAAWSQKIHGDAWLSIKPNLPPSWKSVTFRNFKLLGRSYTLTTTQTATHVAPGDH